VLRRRTRTNAARVQRPPRLVLRFAISSAALLALGAFVILIFVRQHAISQAESAAVFHSRFIVRSVLGERLRPSDFARPLSRDRTSALDSVTEADVLYGDTLAVELFSPGGRVTYASDRRLVGTSPADAAHAEATIRTGEVAKKIETYRGHKVLKVFVPVPFIGSEEAAGALAMVEDYGPIAASGRHGMLPVIGVLLLVLLTLYLSLFPLLRRVTARLRAQVEQIEKLALYDVLTGLANRRLFHDRLEQAFLQAQRNGTAFSLMLLDLDRFKEINDTLGHHAGDAVLTHLADRLKEVARVSDTIARLGGDEFALVLLGAHDGASALFVAERIRRALDEPFVVDGLALQVETSIGIAVFPRHGDNAEQLLKRADIALYASKDSHAPVVYAPVHERHSVEGLNLVAQIRNAIDEGEFVVYFQPEVHLATGKTKRVEALVRWNHPEHGLLWPESFIPLACESSLVRPVTRFVLDTALRQCRAWKDAGIEVGVAVNLAARDLADSRLEEEVADALHRWRLEPRRLELEIPENAVMSERESVQKMLNRLSSRGVRIAIDDFGSGYASLSQLKQLPVDVLKIDQSFVQNVGTNDEDLTIVRSTIDLAHSLGIVVVAEGVESEHVLERLRELGCDLAQGYCVAHPAPAAEVTAWLAGADRAAA
jgi:diguanylate cyclase (GGDEF)-like protein